MEKLKYSSTTNAKRAHQRNENRTIRRTYKVHVIPSLGLSHGVLGQSRLHTTSTGNISAVILRSAFEIKEKQGGKKEEKGKVHTMVGFIFSCKYLSWVQTETW